MKHNDGMGSSRAYKRGAIMGLTVAEAFILLTFVLLLLFTWWQVDSERRYSATVEALAGMSDAQKRTVIEGLADGSFELADKLRKAGVRLDGISALTDISNFSRFISEEDLRRLLNGAVELEPDTILSLADAVEITPDLALRSAMHDLINPDQAVTQVSQRLADAAADEKRMVDTLDQELGQMIRQAGGSISPDGTITLPDTILFDPGSKDIRDQGFLKSLCAPWIRTMEASSLDVAELKIEGHASSEGRPGQTPDQAYLSNLSLSQQRAQNALGVCLTGITDPTNLKWAQNRLSATGYSSSHVVLDQNGNEDRAASRRVTFSVGMNRERLLDDIREDLGAGETSTEAALLAQPKEAGNSLSEVKGFAGTPRIVDGDTLVIDSRRWRLSGIDAPEMRQQCARSDGTAYACGVAAQKALEDIIAGSPVSCRELELDRYGRSVGVCYAGATDIGKAMVEAGMAVPYLEYSEEYMEEGEAARESAKGLWSGEFQPPAEYRKMK
jgi:endonuclease YncB( thermonuclease family)/outer membrane protein OmpA-like peptidoglycan-associated protein